MMPLRLHGTYHSFCESTLWQRDVIHGFLKRGLVVVHIFDCDNDGRVCLPGCCSVVFGLDERKDRKML